MNTADAHSAPAPDGAERRSRGDFAAFAAATPAVSAQSLTLVWTAGFLAGSRWNIGPVSTRKEPGGER